MWGFHNGMMIFYISFSVLFDILLTSDGLWIGAEPKKIVISDETETGTEPKTNIFKETKRNILTKPEQNKLWLENLL